MARAAKRPAAEPGWFFEKWAYTGGANAAAFRNALAGAGINLADLLARETVQNSVDANDGTGRAVRVDFHTISFDSKGLRNLREAIGLTTPRGTPLERKGIFKRGAETELLDVLKPPFTSLIVDDYHTAGLSGTHRPIPLESGDNYFRLCMELGGTKEFEHERGGTYGYGKSVNWVASSVWTVIFYSRFAPSVRSDGASERFLAVSWFRDHDHKGERFTGRAWYGDLQQEDGQSFPAAFVGAEARRRAQLVGLQPRTASQAGLSLMILGTNVAMGELQRGVEKAWWPRLLDQRLEVVFGDESLPAAPERNPALSRFVRCWRLLSKEASPADTDLVSEEQYRRVRLGSLALTTYVDDEEEARADTERARIALVRGPGMVVDYHLGPFLQSAPVTEGVFRADSDLDEVLAKSEPPAHNRWDYRSTRGDRPLSDDERQLIAKIYEKIDSRTRAFLHEHRESPPTPPDRCRPLEILLGRYLRIEPDKPDPNRERSPFRVRFLEQPAHVMLEDSAYIDAKVALSLSENAEDREYLCRVTCWAQTIVEHGGVGESLPMDFMALVDRTGDTQHGTVDRHMTSATCVLSGDDEVQIDLRSKALPHPEYRATLIVRVAEDL